MIISSPDCTSPIEESRKRGRPNGEDHISDLPESVISRILSRLPTKDAVRTSVLSKDWEYKWTCICNVNIDDQVLFSSLGTNRTTFVDFVDRVLSHSQNLKKFYLFCRGNYNLRRVTAWISVALRRNVESFELKYHHDGIVLPRSLLNNSSLQELKLRLPCTMKAPSRTNFPNLTILYMYRVKILNSLSHNEKLVFTFPVLETCRFKKCKWLNAKVAEIYAPALTSFRSKSPYVAIGHDNSIKIFGPKLLKFVTSGCLPENFILIGAPVVKAYLFHYNYIDDSEWLGKSGPQFLKLLKGFSNLKKFGLSDDAMEAIALSKHKVSLPRYAELRKLSLDTGAKVEDLLELLHHTPFLKVLSIGVSKLEDYDYVVMEFVPSCIVSHLEEVRLQNYSGNPSCTSLAKFLFKNSVKLRKFYVCIVSNTPKIPIMEQLSALPKASSRCSIVHK